MIHAYTTNLIAMLQKRVINRLKRNIRQIWKFYMILSFILLKAALLKSWDFVIFFFSIKHRNKQKRKIIDLTHRGKKVWMLPLWFWFEYWCRSTYASEILLGRVLFDQEILTEEYFMAISQVRVDIRPKIYDNINYRYLYCHAYYSLVQYTYAWTENRRNTA